VAGLRGAFFDTSILIAGSIDFGRSSQHALLLMDAVANGQIERPLTACIAVSSSTRDDAPTGRIRLEPEIALRLLREEIFLVSRSTTSIETAGGVPDLHRRGGHDGR